MKSENRQSAARHLAENRRRNQWRKHHRNVALSTAAYLSGVSKWLMKASAASAAAVCEGESRKWLNERRKIIETKYQHKSNYQPASA
jgi:hypothetical protein